MYVPLYMSPPVSKRRKSSIATVCFFVVLVTHALTSLQEIFIHTQTNFRYKALSLNIIGESDYFGRNVSPVRPSFFPSCFMYLPYVATVSVPCLLTFVLPHCLYIHTFAKISLEVSFGTCSMQYFMTL